MTVTAPDPAATRTHPLRTALRLVTTDTPRRVARPWLVLAAIMAVVWAVVWFVRLAFDRPTGWRDEPPADVTVSPSGHMVLLLLFVPVLYAALVHSTMPFAQHLGVTRRWFAGATVLLVLAETLLHAMVMTLLFRLQLLTDGWGVGATFASLNFMYQPNVLLQVVAVWVPLLALTCVALLFGAVRHRWGAAGVWGLWGLVFGAFAAGFTQGLIADVFDQGITETLVTPSFATILLGSAVAALVIAWLVVRRAPVR